MINMTNDIGEIIQVRYNLLIDSKEKESHADCQGTERDTLT